MTIPSKVILLTDLSKFPFSNRFFGSVLLLEKLKVMMLHLSSLITILFFIVPAASRFKTIWRKSNRSSEKVWANVVLSPSLLYNIGDYLSEDT